MNQCARLGLGTVQWGMAYGIANQTGQPSPAEVGEMLQLMREHGALFLDTAHAYGESEKVLGEQKVTAQGFQVVTKTKPIQSLEITMEVVRAVTFAFHESLAKLGCRRVYGLLVHHADTLLMRGGRRLWDALVGLKAEGQVRKIGVSVYHPRQLENILNQYQIDLVQLPFNVYDQRFAQSGLLSCMKRMQIEIHARSAFLQGLLLIAPDELPLHFSSIQDHHRQLHTVFRTARLTPLQGCLHYCLSNSDIDQVIVGCETTQQLRTIVHAVEDMTPCGVLSELKSLSINDETILNPSNWRLITSRTIG